MQTSAIVAVITDGAEYWTELFQGDNPQGTFARHVDPKRWGSLAEARERSPWWPAGDLGAAASEEHERMHRALCSWASCSHQVLWSAKVEASR